MLMAPCRGSGPETDSWRNPDGRRMQQRRKYGTPRDGVGYTLKFNDSGID